MDEPVRVGLVGCGRHGTNLADALIRAKSTLLVACADPDDEALGRMRSRVADAHRYASLDDLLARSPVDAVVIATPHHLLAPLSVVALRRGKHVFAEKPIGLTEQDARLIETVPTQTGLFFMSGYSFRFSLTRCVHELMREGAVGQLCAITGSIGVGPMQDGWTADVAQGGGPLLYVGSHLIDAMLWLAADKPRQVSAEMDKSPTTGIDVTTSFRLSFGGGVIGQGLITQAAPGLAFDLMIYGTGGWLRLHGFNFLQFDVEVFSKKLSAYAEPTTIRPFSGPDNIAMMLVPEMEEFAAAIREQRQPSITASDGADVLRVIDGVRRSAETGRAVDLTQP